MLVPSKSPTLPHAEEAGDEEEEEEETDPLSEEDHDAIAALLDIPGLAATDDLEVEVVAWADGAPVATVSLAPSVFGVPVRRDVVHEVVRWQLARRRKGNGQVCRVFFFVAFRARSLLLSLGCGFGLGVSGKGSRGYEDSDQKLYCYTRVLMSLYGRLLSRPFRLRLLCCAQHFRWYLRLA